jgi:hypothetical protein
VLISGTNCATRFDGGEDVCDVVLDCDPGNVSEEHTASIFKADSMQECYHLVLVCLNILTFPLFVETGEKRDTPRIGGPVIRYGLFNLQTFPSVLHRPS